MLLTHGLLVISLLLRVYFEFGINALIFYLMNALFKSEVFFVSCSVGKELKRTEEGVSTLEVHSVRLLILKGSC